MGEKILENSSFAILRTNPKLTGNVKVVIDSSDNIFIESIDANDELAKSKYKAFKTSSSSGYQYDISRVFGNTPSDLFYDVKKPVSDYTVLDNYGSQYDLDYCYGSYSVNSQSYKEEFGIFAPLWLENNLPDYFVIFRIDGPVTINNKDAATENENSTQVENPINFKSLFLSKAKIIKTFNLTNSTNAGRYIKNYRNSENFPTSALNFSTRRDQPTYWNGVNVNKPGGFTNMAENLYDTFFSTDRTILENDFFITTGFERNRAVCANIINFEFLFDDPGANPLEINRYFGFFVNAEQEGTFRISSKNFFIRADRDGQTRPENQDQFSSKNEISYTVNNPNGVKLYADTEFITTVYDIPDNSSLTASDFLPRFSDVNELNSIFFVKDKHGNLYNLNYSNSWLDNDEIRLANTSIDISDFSGFEESILNARSLFSDKPSKASTVLTVNSEIQQGDRFVVALPKKQAYTIKFEKALAGDTVTVQSGSESFNFILSSSDVLQSIDDLSYNWSIQDELPFSKYKLSIKNDILTLVENYFTAHDDNFTVTANSTVTEIQVIKTVSADLTENIISAQPGVAINRGQAVGLCFNPYGTPVEIAKSMASAINNIKERFFEAVAIDNRVVIIAKVAGPRFNSLVIGRDIFLSSSSVDLITSENAFNTESLNLYYFQGGTNNFKSKAIVDFDLFETFTVPNRYLRTISNKNSNDTLVKIKSVFYYTDSEIRDINGNLIGFNNFDNYCVVAIDDKFEIYTDSQNCVHLYELFDIPFGRLSFFPIKSPDFNFLSTEYGDLKELETEKNYYQEFLKENTTYQTHFDINKFYSGNNFISLLNVLENESFLFDKNINTEQLIGSEYDRLRENSQVTTSVPSRTVPYINKWVYRNGKNVRETDYRLNVSPAFGLTNFSPAANEIYRNPIYFTHEWYYLQGIPTYYASLQGESLNTALNNIFSYFPEQIKTDSSGLKSIDVDYFTNYFTVNYQNYPVLNSNSSILPFEYGDRNLFETKKQFRYSLFEGANSSNFSTSLFRGVKVVVKERVENEIEINYNLPEIKLKNDTRYNGYKFSCVLIPHNGTYDNIKRKTIEYEFIENRKYKSICFLIYLKIEDILTESIYDDGIIQKSINPEFIDRTILYALDSKFESFEPDSNYSDIQLSGAIDARGTSNQAGNLKGIKSSQGQVTLFTEEILINKNGFYNQIVVEPVSLSSKTYNIKNIQDNSSINISQPFSYYGGTASLNQFQSGTFTYLNGGYNFWIKRLDRVSFAFIQNLVNNGDPSIKYTTVLENGNSVSNTFIIELQTAAVSLSSNYLTPFRVENKSNVINDLTVLVGDTLVATQTPSIVPLYRHGGYYQPKFIDIVDFKDPYIILSDDIFKERKQLIKDYMSDKNTEFMTYTGTALNPYANADHGKLENLYFHKTNDINPSGVIQLSLQSSELPVYPITGEIAIDKTDFYIFKTNWDGNYFKRSINKNSTESLIGTRSTVEKRSFFGSKIMKIFESITAETFNSQSVNSLQELNSLSQDVFKPGNTVEVLYFDSKNQIVMDIYLEKRLIRQLSEAGIYSYFSKYINPKYSFGTQDGIEDDVNGYIKTNILPRYLLSNIELYVLKSGQIAINQTYPVVESSLTDIQKISAGFKVDKNIQVQQLGNLSNFNQRLIYNKTVGYNYSFAPSFTLNKK